MSRNENDYPQYQSDFGGNMEMTSIPQGRRRNTNRAYTNLNSNDNNNQHSNQNYSEKEETTSNSEAFIPPVPESLRPTYNRTYISPEPNETSNYSNESNTPPQIPPNASYRYEYIPNLPSQSQNTNKSSNQSGESYVPPVPESLRPTYNSAYISPEPKETSNYNNNNEYISPQVLPDASFRSVQRNSSQSSNLRPKERKYVDPYPEKEYENERKREQKNSRTNIPSQQEQQNSSNNPNRFSTLRAILWIIAFLIIFCLSF